MRVLNFLPGDYVTRRLVRRANLLCLAVAGGSLLAIGLVTGGIYLRMAGIRSMRGLVDQQYAQASRQIEDLKQLENRKQGLLHKVELSTALLERVPRSLLVARLTNCLPAQTSLTSLQMQAEEVDVPLAPTEAAAGAVAAADPKAKGAAKPATRKVTRLRFRLDGLAETDVQVAKFMSNLGEDPLFEEVDLQFSEEFPYKEGVTMRRFQLALLLSPGAAKTLEGRPPAAPEAAAAGTAQAAAPVATKGKS